jgi:hypothetical protein
VENSFCAYFLGSVLYFILLKYLPVTNEQYQGMNVWCLCMHVRFSVCVKVEAS